MTQSGTSGQANWQQLNNNALMMQVDFPQAFNGSSPAIVCSLVCDSQLQPPISGMRVMNPNGTGFMALLQLADGADITTAEARAYNWRVSWIAVE